MTTQSPPSASGTSQTGASGRVHEGRAADPAARYRPDQTRLAWEGDLDIASAPVLARALGVLSDLGVRTVMLDASAVAFMDCAGLSALLDADNRLEDGLRLERPSRAVVRLLALLDLTDRLATTGETAPTISIADIGTTIEQSKGLIMGSFQCTADQASKMLLSTALQQNIQVQVLAGLLVTVASSDLGHPHGGPALAVQRVMASPSTTTSSTTA